MNGGPIQVCPVCNYDLQSLPRNYRCPECGFEYEETMRVWTTRFPLVMAVVPLGIFSAMLLIVGLKMYLSQTFAIPRHLSIALAIGLFTLAINFANYYFMRGFIVVGRDGITYRFGWKRRLWFHPWQDVRIKVSLLSMDLLLPGPILPKYLPTKFMKKHGRRELRDEILRRLELYDSLKT